MRPEDLAEATRIVSQLAWIKNARELSLIEREVPGTLRLVGRDYNPMTAWATDMPLVRSAAQAALDMMRLKWDADESELRRRAAQIGLAL